VVHDDRDAIFFQNAVDAELGLGELARWPFPDGGGAFLVDQVVDAEVAQKLEMAPMVERIAQRVGNGADEGLVFFLVAGVARAEALRDAVGPHGAPFVVVARQPDVVEIAEAIILRDLLRRERWQW
jgi:hypothetical protein